VLQVAGEQDAHATPCDVGQGRVVRHVPLVHEITCRVVP
jgi:hypothetical protein